MENGALILAAIAELREYTREGFDRVDQAVRDVNSRLDKLNGKVAEHERRFTLQDGAAAEKEHRRVDLERRKPAAITAQLSAREAIILIILIAAIATGNWELITRWFK